MKKVIILIFFLIFFTPLLLSVSGSRDDGWKNKLSNDLKEEIKKIKSSNLLPSEKKIKLIVFTEDKSSVQRFGDIRYEFSIIPAVAMEVPISSLEELARLHSTKKVLMDHPVKTFRIESIPLMRADAASSTFLVNGTGINISIVDTGIFNHTEFQSPNRIILQKCFISHGSTRCPPSNTDESDNATDDEGHGTHVAGIAAGKGNDFGRGVATNASLFAVKVLNASGAGLDSDVIKGIEWSIQNRAKIISLSLGAPYTEFTDCYEVGLSLAVDNATQQGAVVVVAAGNEGSNYQTIAAPGCAKTAITVGATNKSDGITTYSSRGPTNDNRTKPDIAAIGGILDSCSLPTQSVISTYLNDDYACAYGTSMATPFVSGTVALLLENFNRTFGYFPEPARVKAILVTAVNTSGMNADGYSQRNNVYGSGRIDVYEALRIINYTKNDTISQGEEKRYFINITQSEAKVTLYWPENSTISNNLDLIVGNFTHNFSYPTDANDTIEQVFLSNVNNGIWSIYVRGITVTSSQKFYLASSVPFVNFITIESPLNKSYNNLNIHFNMTVGEAISNAWVEINNTANYTLLNDTLTHYYNISVSLPEGFHNATFYANTTFGNVLESTVYFTIDLTKPTILIQNPENFATYNYAEIPLNFTVIENFAVDWCGYSLNKGANVTLPGCQNTTLSLQDANHNITVYVNDTAGNMNSSVVFFTVASPPKYLISGTNVTTNIIGKYGAILLFANWTDNDDLGFAWLETNETGTPKNYTDYTERIYGSPVDINLTSGQTWSNFTWQNTSVILGSVVAWKIFANDTTGKENVTLAGFFTIDNSTPKYFDPKSTPAIYNENIQLNITWKDDTLHTVILEINFTNSTPAEEMPYNFTNYTVTTRNGDKYHFTILAGNQTTGKFVVYRWYANDSSNLWNFTEQFNFTVSKAPTLTRLFLNGTEGNRTYIRGDIANITASVNVTGKNVTIVANYSGAVVLANGTSPQSNITDTTSLLGTYNITAFFPGDENYTSSNVTYFLTVSTLPDGSSCNSNIQCTSNICCHNVCRNTCPFCGDNICEAGENYVNCPADCPAPPTPAVVFIPPPPVYVYDFSLELPSRIEIFANESKEFSLIVKNTANGTLTDLKVVVRSEPYCCVIGISPEKVESLKPTNSTSFSVAIPAGVRPDSYNLIFNVSSEQLWKEGITQLVVKELPPVIDVAAILERLTGLFTLIGEKEKEGYDVSKVLEVGRAAKAACDAKQYEKCQSLIAEAEAKLKWVKKLPPPFPSIPLIVIAAVVLGVSVGTLAIAKRISRALPPIPHELSEQISSLQIELEKVKGRGIDISDCLEELGAAQHAAKLGLKELARLHLENVRRLIEEKLKG